MLLSKKMEEKINKNQEPPVDVEHQLAMLEATPKGLPRRRCLQRRTIAPSAAVLGGYAKMLLA